MNVLHSFLFLLFYFYPISYNFLKKIFVLSIVYSVILVSIGIHSMLMIFICVLKLEVEQILQCKN